MNKDDVVEAFSAVCNYIADNLDQLANHLDDEMPLIKPIFEDARISDIDEWWEVDNHLAKFIMQMEEFCATNPNYRSDLIQDGLAEMEDANALLQSQMNELIKRGNDMSVIQVLKYLPHDADYAICLKETKGYQELAKKVGKLNNVGLWPIITLDYSAQELPKAFRANVAIYSNDGSPLKPKLKSRQPLIF